MKLSTKGKYGLRALIDLALHSEEEAVSLNCIAARQNISLSYLEQLVAKLRKAGLVVSIRGAGGGYKLARDPKEISVGDILRALEGSLEAVDCPGLEPENPCESSDFCVAKYVWDKINTSITNAVDEMNLAQLVEENKKVKNKDNVSIDCPS